jgi:hypothetical protein
LFVFSLPVGCANQREEINNNNNRDFGGLSVRSQRSKSIFYYLFYLPTTIVANRSVRTDASPPLRLALRRFLFAVKTTTTSKNNNNNKKEQQQATTTATTTVAASIAIVAAAIRDTVGSSRYPVP